jgi:hypothetical protein
MFMRIKEGYFIEDSLRRMVPATEKDVRGSGYFTYALFARVFLTYKDIHIYTGYRDKGYIYEPVPSRHLCIRKGDTDARRR